jgi:hypothetical protein
MSLCLMERELFGGLDRIIFEKLQGKTMVQ